ncbi:Vegetative incompatibility HET-E-1 protein [Rutstroemia sp. NJR-2017a WRK4]|nr:Vegetative incompatibility HET-E-1 protein [Rutstroemia sp. NJR-2017a WRK4]
MSHDVTLNFIWVSGANDRAEIVIICYDKSETHEVLYHDPRPLGAPTDGRDYSAALFDNKNIFLHSLCSSVAFSLRSQLIAAGMDPVIAVGFAASILTFVDFAWSVVTGAYEVYKSPSGETVENAHLGNIIDDLRLVAEELENAELNKGSHERSLRRLAEKCSEVSEQLLNLLQKLRVKGSKTPWKSLKTKWLSLQKSDEIVELKDRLRDYRSEILLRLNMMFSDQQSSIGKQLEAIKNDGRLLRTRTASQLEEIRNDLIKMAADLRHREQEDDKSDQSVAVAISFVPANTRRAASTSAAEESLGEVKKLLQRFQSMALSIPTQHRILRQLIFPAMHNREDSIHDAVEGTFEWILDADQSEESAKVKHNAQSNLQARTRELYINWLREGHGIFHVSGKAGSGKSTLMRLLASHPRTKQQLEVWAGNKTLGVARFFFWESSGDPLQKSLQGLYRSILFEILSQCPDLIPHVFPAQWQILSGGEGDGSVEATLFRPRMIQEAFDLLVTKTSIQGHRLCIFIDGLDEYEGDSFDHRRLAESLQTWCTGESIKICVSCRPYDAFTKAFSSAVTIYLHELNEHDIRVFSQHMFEKDASSAQISNSYIGLVDEIVSMAEGVFLWAFLVVRLMLTSVLRGDPIEIQKEKLRSVPRGLDDLYDRLLQKIDKTDRERSNQMLLLAAMNPWSRPLKAVVFSWLSQLGDSGFPSTKDFYPYSDKEVDDRIEFVGRQLNDLTKGLLEVRTLEKFDESASSYRKWFVSSVEFFHRTARDYLLCETRLNQLLSSFPGFYNTDPYGRLLLAEAGFLVSRYIGFSVGGREDYVGESLSAPRRLPGFLADSTIRSFKDVLETPRSSLLLPELNTWSQIELDEPGSFVHYAAWLGLQDYVTQEIDLNPSLMSPTNDLSILMPIIHSKNTSLLETVLKKGVSLHQDLQVVHDNQIKKYPLWVMAVAACLRKCTHASSDIQIPTPREMLKLLVHFGASESCSLHFYTLDFDDRLLNGRKVYRGPFITSLRDFLHEPFEVRPPWDWDRNYGLGDQRPFWEDGPGDETSRQFHIQMLSTRPQNWKRFFRAPIIVLDDLHYDPSEAQVRYRLW